MILQYSWCCLGTIWIFGVSNQNYAYLGFLFLFLFFVCMISASECSYGRPHTHSNSLVWLGHTPLTKVMQNATCSSKRVFLPCAELPESQHLKLQWLSKIQFICMWSFQVVVYLILLEFFTLHNEMLLWHVQETGGRLADVLLAWRKRKKNSQCFVFFLLSSHMHTGECALRCPAVRSREIKTWVWVMSLPAWQEAAV